MPRPRAPRARETEASSEAPSDPLGVFHEATRRWFASTLGAPTPIQARAFPVLAAHASALLLAPTGSGKTLAAFLAALDHLMFRADALGATLGAEPPGVEVLYLSPLKALGADVERNLRAPLAGLARMAEAGGFAFRAPTVGVRTGDTPARERAELSRRPPSILITTPESLYLLLTSAARASLTRVRTVIVDEIHTMVATKRGAHLFTSLERLEELRAREPGRAQLQRIGLSATQRPLELVARVLGGLEPVPDAPRDARDAPPMRPRPVQVLEDRSKKSLVLSVELPEPPPAGPPEAVGRAERGPPADLASPWPGIHARLVELVRAHRSTMIFVNSRRLAERLAAALNELAGEELALAHHGSVARERRRFIEERLKSGSLPALVATSSLELGIDVGAVELVVQVEAPPSVAAGLQRVGRSGHSVGATSRGVLVPKHASDLLAAAAVSERMLAFDVEPTSPLESPLDVLAQQLVATVAMDDLRDDELFAMVRGAAPFATLPRAVFDDVLDMLSGKYPSVELSDLRPRVTYDRGTGVVTAREGARRIAVTSGGTIPDRGSTGCFCAPTSAATCASASSTKRWCSSRGAARSSCWARARGASTTSRTTECSSRPPRVRSARCRSGAATAPAGPTPWGARWAP
jgi:ATP-dependent Lhr-like helicase